MRNAVLLSCAVLIAAGCGVNPDRVAEMSERSEYYKTRSFDKRKTDSNKRADSAADAEDEPPLEFDDNDPAAIRQAIMDLEDLQKLVKNRRYADYLAKRYELMTTMQYEADEAVATSAKTPLIIDRVYTLDKRVAKAGSERAVEVVGTTGRVQVASADALYALKDALGACERATSAANEQAMNDAAAQYESALTRVESVDVKALTYVGEKATGGGYMDVPAEIAVCEARLASKKALIADAPPAPNDRTREYQGCGYYAVELEAKQTAENKFSDYLITSAFVADADPGAANAVDCGVIPPVSDAEQAVQNVVKQFVAWLEPADIVSMDGKFQYEPGPDGKLTKKGVARVYRKQATLKTNECGAEPGTSCEAAGSKLATAFNHASHYMGRADYYKRQGDPDRCKAMADMAFKSAGASAAEAEAEQIQVSGGQTFTPDALNTKLGELKSTAEQAMTSDWCATP